MYSNQNDRTMKNTLGRSARRLLSQGLRLALVLSLAACGGGGDGSGTEPPAANHKVSGTVSGLTVNGFVLAMEVANEVAIVAIPANSTSFEFAKRVNHNERYHIGVHFQPAGQACSVGNITGTALADVSNVVVSCRDATGYTINASAGPHGTISPSGTVSVSSMSNVEFVATPDPGYVVDSWQVQGGGSATGSGSKARFYNVNADGHARVTFRPALLTANVPVLALSVNDPANDAALTGTPRNIVITNSSSTTTATGLSVSLPSFPAGTTSSSTCAGTLAPGATCSITITPGSTPTSLCPRSYPAPATVTVSATEETKPLSIGVVVLSYGCTYQSGLIFAIDDTTPATSSIGGKITNANDLETVVPWSPDDQLVGVGRNSVSPCMSDADGECNSATILAHYVAYGTKGFAAGVCKGLDTNIMGNGQVGWYLPAYCEMSDCGAGQPSMQANLWARNNLRLLSGTYSTSTETANAPTTQAQAVTFLSDSVAPVAMSKRQKPTLRCVRKLN
jgi:hypothetical protein